MLLFLLKNAAREVAVYYLLAAKNDCVASVKNIVLSQRKKQNNDKAIITIIRNHLSSKQIILNKLCVQRVSTNTVVMQIIILE